MKKKLSDFGKKYMIIDFGFWPQEFKTVGIFFDIFVLCRDMTFLFSFFQHCTSFLFFPVRTLDPPPPKGRQGSLCKAVSNTG